MYCTPQMPLRNSEMPPATGLSLGFPSPFLSGDQRTGATQKAIDQPLPTLPLWLTDNLAVPLELDASCEETCRILRIP